ncbi:MAG: hypothetical protein CL927_00870 [Deltaproteobacteria bacterium]|nr:hypothetical protein [Deltaproteobacteria bacterium]
MRYHFPISFTLTFLASAAAQADTYSNDFMTLGDIHNECLQSFGEARGGWENVNLWPTTSFDEVYAETVACTAAHSQDPALTQALASELFPQSFVACGISGSVEDIEPAALDAMFELEDIIDEHVALLVTEQVPRPIVLDQLTDAMREIDASFDLSAEGQLTYGAAAAIGYRSFEFWTEPGRLDAQLEMAQQDGDDDDDGGGSVGGSDGGGDDKGSSGGGVGVKKIAKVIKADMQGGAWGAAAGAAIGAGAGGLIGLAGGPFAGVTVPAGVSGGGVAGGATGAAVGGIASSIVEALEDDVSEPGETEGEGGEWTPEDGDCPRDSFPTP